MGRQHRMEALVGPGVKVGELSADEEGLRRSRGEVLREPERAGSGHRDPARPLLDAGKR